MLNDLSVPVLAVVENMAYFRCDECGKDHYPFGRGHLDAVLASIAMSANPSRSITIFRSANAPDPLVW